MCAPNRVSRPTASATSASSASSTIFRTASLISSLRASPSATPWLSSSLSFWLVRSEAGILVSTGMPTLAAGANRRRLVCGPSKSASPSRYPASLGLHQLVKALGQNSGLPELHPHAFRHSCGVELLRRTRGNLRAVQEHLRHQDIQTT